MLKLVNILNELNEILVGPQSENDNSSYNGSIDNMIFRGQADENWALLPKLFRCQFKHNDEQKLIAKYKQRYNIQHNSMIEILSEMQHYGMPTRLLDWTTNFLVALYFAVEDPKFDDKNAAIYIINPSVLLSEEYITPIIHSNDLHYVPSYIRENSIKDFFDKTLHKYLLSESELKYINKFSFDQSFDDQVIEQNVQPIEFVREIIELNDKYKKEFYRLLTTPAFIEPFNTNVRVIAQSSVFTLHFGTSSNSEIKNLFGSINCTGIDYIKEYNKSKLIIRWEDKKPLRDELHKLFGMNSASIFPDNKEKVLAKYFSQRNESAKY